MASRTYIGPEKLHGVRLSHAIAVENLVTRYGALALNAVYVAAGVGIFFAAFRGARQRGALLQMGE